MFVGTKGLSIYSVILGVSRVITQKTTHSFFVGGAGDGAKNIKQLPMQKFAKNL